MESQLLQKCVELAKKIQDAVASNMSYQEKNFHHKMQKLLNNPINKVMLIELLDKSFRSQNAQSNFEITEYVLEKYDVDFFTDFERFLLFGFLNLGGILPRASMPFFMKHIRKDTKKLVLDANPDSLYPHIISRKNKGILININMIGEEVQGEDEAKNRIHEYELALKSEVINYISIKITTIYSQIHPLDFQYSKSQIIPRLKHLYAIASEEEKRQNQSKFINLDMEEFKDLELTVQSFMEALEEFDDLEAGIVLQAYIPDSFHFLKILHNFSKSRVLRGSKPIKIRFVKGANMEMEETIASQRGWQIPTFRDKIHTDACYKKMIDFILEDDNYRYIQIGIASHNLFEIAYAYTLAEKKNALNYFTFEMLEGMSEQTSIEISSLHKLILYAPVCNNEHFNNAIAYLVRRLDENTTQDNFMRYFFNLKAGDKNWEVLKEKFLDSILQKWELSCESKKTQNRNLPQNPHNSYLHKSFINEADTDFSIKDNRIWAERIREKYLSLPKIIAHPIIGSALRSQLDPIFLRRKSLNNSEVIAEIYLADKEILALARERLRDATWKIQEKYVRQDRGRIKTPRAEFEKIWEKLSRTAEIMANKRGDLIGMAMLEGGKTFLELDTEVSEAIDFLEFYPYSLYKLLEENPQTIFTPKGGGVVITPWNFPIGIAVGSITAPLACGNSVIFKPSSLSSLVGLKICECFWEGGFSKQELIYLPASGSELSQHLMDEPSISFTVLTGGEESAYSLLKVNPFLSLSAETGGKNAIIVTKFADKDLAIKNIVHSAFSNSGQKCSAASLLILEKEVYEDEGFKKALVDATKSLSVGDCFAFHNKLSCLGTQVNEKIKKAMEELDEYEEWVLVPRFLDENCSYMTPGIKYGTQLGDFTYKTELFCPILSVMCAEDLSEAIELANQTGYGLTAGLQSLDEREWKYFKKNIEAGNIYINKPTTGAIVLRQPFGGMKKSAIGFGRKVGAPNYVTLFLNIIQEEVPSIPNIEKDNFTHPFLEFIEEIDFDFIFDSWNESNPNLKTELIYIVQNYIYHYLHEFSKTREFIKIRGEDNFFGYKKIKSLLYIVSQKDSLREILLIIFSSCITKVSLALGFEDKNLLKTKAIRSLINFLEENFPKIKIYSENFEDKKISFENFERIRYMGNKPWIYETTSSLGKVIIGHKPLLNGRFELLYYYNEQSFSISYHRYGNLGIRAENFLNINQDERGL